MTKQDSINIYGARVHNLKNIDLEIPRNKLVVFTGLSGSGKSTHGLYVFNKENSAKYKSLFNIDMLDIVIDQSVKNDDVIGIFKDEVFGSENGSWTKTEDLDEEQLAVYNSAISPNALHENTEFDKNGNPSVKGELFQYWGKFNQNARTILSLDDTGYFSGNVIQMHL